MQKIILTMILIFLFGCSQIKEGVSLIEEYESYIKSIENNNVLFVKNMLASGLRKKIVTLGEEQFPIIRSFPNVVSDINSYHQLIDSNKGCLTVNGYDKKHSPVSLYIEYVNESGKWLLSFVEVYYLDTPKEFESVGICPTKF